MKFLLFLSALFILTESKRDEKVSVETYFLKNRINDIDIPNWPSVAITHFIAKQNDILDTPFIRDSEILGYDSSKLKIKFSKSAAEKIAQLRPDIPDGIQFVLTVNREPVLNGYFVNKFTSEPVFSYSLSNINDTIQRIAKFIPGDTVDSRRDSRLLRAFLSTNRLSKTNY